MADTDISVTPAVLFIDVGAGATSATAVVDYRSIRPMVLWERLNLGAWTRVNLFAVVGTEDADVLGSFTTAPLRPGDLLEYRSYFYEDLDPNDLPSERYQFVQARVQALVSTPREQPWITEQTTDVGGTFYRRLIATPPMFTTIHAEIGPDKPVQNLTSGLQELPTVVASVDSVLQEIHTITLLPLLAGNDYFCTLRINDEQGEWFTIVEDLSTLRRTVSVDYNSIFINNDGDSGGTGEAEFWVTTFQGKEQIAQIHFGDDEYAILTGTSIAVSGHVARGPEVVTPDNQAISVNATGIEYDGWFESDEPANTWGYPQPLRRTLEFPAGTGENLTNQYFQVQAVPGSVDATFAFTVRGTYSVNYS